MPILLAFLLFFLGLIVLVKCADFLVDGASSAAAKFKISPIVIGLTVVAFGTSAPELIVSVTSALNGSTDIALGNIVGSNIMNILIILGISAIIFPLSIKKNTVWKEIPMSFLAAIIIAILGLGGVLDSNSLAQVNLSDNQNVLGTLGFSAGLVLLAFFVVFMYYTFGIAKVEGEGEESEIKHFSTPKSILYIVGGLIGLTLGGRVFVDSAVVIAQSLGLSERLIGLTIVAIGTSMPEMVTSITASLKKNSDIAVGNIVGSNIFNIFFILGITSMIRPIPLVGQNIADMLFLIFVTGFLFISVFLFKKYRISKIEGFSMVLLSIFYIIFLIWRG